MARQETLTLFEESEKNTRKLSDEQFGKLMRAVYAYRFPGVTILAVEANFDHDRLWRCEKLPEKTKHRIENTHMEIGRLLDALKQMDLSRCREIYLLHLSSSSSNEYEFVDKVRRQVPPSARVTACRKGG